MRIVVELNDDLRAYLDAWGERLLAAMREGARRDTAVGAASADANPPERADTSPGEGPQRAEDGQRADAARASDPAQADGEDVGVSRRLPAPSGTALRKWSAERVALLREHWPSLLASVEILRRLNALPGPEVTMNQMQTYASVQLHLKRPEGVPRKVRVVPPIGSPLRPNGQAQRPAPVTTEYVAQLQPVPADFDTIYSWAGNHGIPSFDGSVEMVAAVNAKRLRVGLSPFRLVRRA